uniref:Uncharacterized protein n=1 Tax=Setaria viridis TaxID=4556 RepID=A0A4U6U5A4_SETVI|nr:hypothetical protein SEVIR_6G033256v2 [Setaria viridis]
MTWLPMLVILGSQDLCIKTRLTPQIYQVVGLQEGEPLDMLLQSMDWVTKSQSMVTCTASEYYCWKFSQEKDQQIATSCKTSTFIGTCK